MIPIRVIDLTTEQLIQLIVEALPMSTSPTCEEVKTLQPEFLTRKQASELLSVSFTTLHQWNKDSKLLARKIGGKVFYLREDVINQLKSAA
jgi:hypothetical protein